MDADIKSLEAKVSKLIALCSDLQQENKQLRGDLAQAQESAATLKGNMQLASNKLESLLGTLPQDTGL